MKTSFTFIFIAFMHYTTSAQTVANIQEMKPKSDTYQKAYKLGSVIKKKEQTLLLPAFSMVNMTMETIKPFKNMQMASEMVSGLIIVLKVLKNAKGPTRTIVLKGPLPFIMKMAL